jgi:hypothetical protein
MNDQTNNSNKPEGGARSAQPPTPPANDSSKAQTAAHAPNIQFVGRREQLNKVTGKTELVPAIASRSINDGETIIKLPSDEKQKEGFYSKHAARLFALYPDDYKKPVAKGEKQ